MKILLVVEQLCRTITDRVSHNLLPQGSGLSGPFDQQEYGKVRLILASSEGRRSTLEGRGDSSGFWPLGPVVISFAVFGSGLSMVPRDHETPASLKASLAAGDLRFCCCGSA
jgi:hypothetical protein